MYVRHIIMTPMLMPMLFALAGIMDRRMPAMYCRRVLPLLSIVLQWRGARSTQVDLFFYYPGTSRPVTLLEQLCSKALLDSRVD